MTDTGTDSIGSKTTTLDSNCATAVCNPTIDPATNKLVGYTFDNAGNTKVDANGQTFTYDAENKQILVKDSSNNTVGEYFYDGDGKRIKKIANGEETIFVYNASGQLVAEYTNQTPQNTPRVSYLTSDHLGSPRITTDADGDVYTRRDFMPFGEEIDVEDTPERTATLNYASDEIKQKFTSYERDNETDLDFAQARMFSYGHGRFTSPDPLAASANPIRPQSWNRYSYSYNNPLRYTDPSGMIAGDFYNLDGDKIGKDGKKDDTIYIVYDKDEAKKIEKTEGDYTATVNSKITIANKEVIKAIGRAVDRSNNPTADDKKGGNHEEGVSWKTDNGKTTTTDLKSGGFSDLKKDTKAHIVIPSSTKADGVAHVHPKNTEIVTENGKQYKLSFDQEPSGTDIKAAYPSGTNIVVGARDKKVYFYQATGNNTGSNNCCVAVMKLDNFLKIGGK